MAISVSRTLSWSQLSRGCRRRRRKARRALRGAILHWRVAFGARRSRTGRQGVAGGRGYMSQGLRRVPWRGGRPQAIERAVRGLVSTTPSNWTATGRLLLTSPHFLGTGLKQIRWSDDYSITAFKRRKCPGEL